MDADDVSLPERFEKQLPLVEQGADIVGSGLLEFESSAAGGGRVVVPRRRTRPRSAGWSAFRDPFNHPTVVYRRSAVQAAGGYSDMALMEDYLLFARMLDAGAQPANLAEPLVRYRVGAGAYARRGGRQLLRSELAVQRRFRELGHHHPQPVPPQRGGPRRLPAGPGAAAPPRVPGADRQPRGRQTPGHPRGDVTSPTPRGCRDRT